MPRCLRTGHIRAECPNAEACRHCLSLGWEFDHLPEDCIYNELYH